MKHLSEVGVKTRPGTGYWKDLTGFRSSFPTRLGKSKIESLTLGHCVSLLPSTTTGDFHRQVHRVPTSNENPVWLPLLYPSVFGPHCLLHEVSFLRSRRVHTLRPYDSLFWLSLSGTEDQKVKVKTKDPTDWSDFGDGTSNAEGTAILTETVNAGFLGTGTMNYENWVSGSTSVMVESELNNIESEDWGDGKDRT